MGYTISVCMHGTDLMNCEIITEMAFFIDFFFSDVIMDWCISAKLQSFENFDSSAKLS